jgi:polysaccharide pyruvyl transferase CsaB
MTKIVLSGYYGFDNWGDEAILETASKGLAAAIPGAEITVLSSSPAKTSARYGLRAVSRTDPRQVLRELRTADMLVSGGGSLLQDVTSSRSLWYYLAIILAAQWLGKKVMLYANGVGPIGRSFNRAVTRRVLNKVPLITVRGPSSKDYLDELGVTRPHVVETADTAFSIEPAGPERVREICRAESLPDLTDPKGRRYVGVVLRPWRGADALEAIMVRAADYIMEKLGYGVLFLPVHRTADLPVVERVMAGMRNESYILRDFYSAAETVGLIGNLRWVLSMRLHPLIFAAVGGVPAIGLVYDPKVEEFLSQAEQVSVGPVEEVTLEDVLLGITEMERDYAGRVARLDGIVSGLKRKAQQNNELAAELLAGRRT